MPEAFDLILLTGTVLTPEALKRGGVSGRAAIAIRGGTIVGLLPESVAFAAGWPHAANEVVDLGDATVSAGFVDAHIHPIMGLRLTRGLDLSGITTRKEARAEIAMYIAALSGKGARSGGYDDDWILAWGLDPAVFEGEEPGNHLLDGVDRGRKVVITLFDGHSILASRAALAAAGVRGDESFLDASAIGLDAEGRPNGMLYEFGAQELMQRAIPEQSFLDRVEQLAALLQGMAESGLVGGQMLDLMAEDSFDLLDELERRQELPIRLRISPSIFPGFTNKDLDRHLEHQRRAGRRWHVRGVKLMIDGTIDNGTAWLFEPDTRGESTRSLWLKPDEYRRAVRFFHAHGIPTTTHAIGDKAVSFVAETLGALPSGWVQHRIEHIETLPDTVLDQVIASGAAASMQPTHCTLYTRADHGDNWSQRLGEERANHAWRTRDLRDRGAILALGSDWPIAPYDPRGIVAAAQLRRRPGRDEAPILPDQGLSARAAIEGYTSEYWRSVGERGGRVEVGMPADLSVWADNPRTSAPDVFATSPVVMTVLGGEIVVDHRDLAPSSAPAFSERRQGLR